MNKLLLIAAALTLTGCSSDGDTIVFNTALGPDTGEQIKSLPSDLRGDSDQANHSAETKIGAGMTSSDGTSD